MFLLHVQCYIRLILSVKLDRKHLYMAFIPSDLALLMEAVGRHKENMTKKTLKWLEMSLKTEIVMRANANERTHCDNVYTAVEMSHPELKYLKQILDIYGAHVAGYHDRHVIVIYSDIVIYGLADLLYMPRRPNVGQILKQFSIRQIDEALNRFPAVHIRVW
jgi:hypothetical protein